MSLHCQWFAYCDRCGIEDTAQPDKNTALSRFNRFADDPRTILCDDCVDDIDPHAEKVLL